ncbi:MAG: dihydroxyacetone kinase subunit L [Austwickia sp.]|jgi:dihydroxyacetone kinase phosphoprotein-dependent L subunit|nr:MAG: dihydroxyacetone kinase subunit L [Austwickia sp.]
MTPLPLERTAAWLRAFDAAVHEHAAELTDLDRAIGDADHGSNMDRGMTAVAALDPAAFTDAAAYLKKAGMTLVSTVGGASGPLYGTFFLRFAAALEQPAVDAGEQGADLAAVVGAALRAGVEGVVARGKAAPGDKTMLDALLPAVDAYDAAAGQGLDAALSAAAAAAADGRAATIPLVALKGRASYLGERSAGHQDPGATSAALLMAAAAATLGAAEAS